MIPTTKRCFKGATVNVLSLCSRKAPSGGAMGRGMGEGGGLCQRTYFPRAKHSSLTVTPLAASTVWGKCASILGSYSPITPKKQKRRHTYVNLFRLHHIWWELSIQVYVSMHIFIRHTTKSVHFYADGKLHTFVINPNGKTLTFQVQGVSVMMETNWHSLSGIHCQCLI